MNEKEFQKKRDIARQNENVFLVPDSVLNNIPHQRIKSLGSVKVDAVLFNEWYWCTGGTLDTICMTHSEVQPLFS